MGHVTSRKQRYWPRGIVDFAIQRGDFTVAQRRSILDGVDRWRNETFFRFVQHSPDRVRQRTKHHILFVIRDENRTGSRSGSLGMDQAFCDIEFDGGRQRIFLHPNFSTETVAHEIGHAVGMLHEHQRPDRDDFIEMHWERVETIGGRYFNMIRSPGSVPHGDYDYHSMMHYGPHNRARTLNYDFAGRVSDLVILDTVTPFGTLRRAVLFDARTGVFSRWEMDVSGRIVGDPLETGIFAARVTDILHAQFRTGLREFRFDRETGALEIQRLDRDGLPTRQRPSNTGLGTGPWSAPAVYERGGAIHFLAFNRGTRELVCRVMQHRERDGITVVPRQVVRRRILDRDFTHIYHAQIGTRHRVFLFSALDHTVEVRTAPIENIGNEINMLRWPGQWGTPNIVRLNAGRTIVAGYVRRRGRFVTFNLRDDGTWTQFREQTEVPANRDIAAITNFVGPRLTLLRQQRNRVSGEVYGINRNSLDLGDRLETGDPTMTRRDDGSDNLGRDVGFTPGDIAAGNFMVDRDLQIHRVGTRADAVGQREWIDDLDQAVRDVVHFRSGIADCLIFVPRDGSPVRCETFRHTFDRNAAGFTDFPVETEINRISHATVLYPRGTTPYLYAVHAADGGPLVRYPLTVGRIRVDEASEPETGFDVETVLTGFSTGSQAYLVGYRASTRNAWVRRLADTEGDEIFSGNTNNFRIGQGVGDICVYTRGSRVVLVAVGRNRKTRLFGFDPGLEIFAEINDAPDLGRGWNEVEASSDGRTLFLYRWSSGKTVSWDIDARAYPSIMRETLEDLPGWAVMRCINTRVGDKLVFARAPFS